MTTNDLTTDAARSAFYRAGLLGLRALDIRERAARRLGPDADLHWSQFAGHLDAADRVDILFRDGAVTWRTAFSPARAFALAGLAPDEPFGPDWKSLAAADARRLLMDVPPSVDLGAVAALLGVSPEAVSIPQLTPRDRIVAVGGAAVLALAVAFRDSPALSWADQVVVAASSPASRQLAGLAAIFLGAGAATRVMDPAMSPAVLLDAVKWQRADHVVRGSGLSAAEQALVHAFATG